MAYQATILRVFIASPSDVTAERTAVADTLLAWNAVNSRSRKVFLEPVRWETHTSPEMSQRPQEIINRQALRDCDILIAIFGTRLGSPTGAAESGTVEEIDEFRQSGRRVLVYFSNRETRLGDLDPDQLRQLKEFRRRCETQGLIGTYGSVDQLRELVARHITEAIGLTAEPDATATTRDEANLELLYVTFVNAVRNHHGNVWDPPFGSREQRYADEMVKRGWLRESPHGGYQLARVFTPRIAPDVQDRVHSLALKQLVAEVEYNATLLADLRYSTAPALRDEAKHTAAQIDIGLSDELRAKLDDAYMKMRSAKGIHQSIQSAIGDATPEVMEIERLLLEVKQVLPTILRELRAMLLGRR